MKFKKKNMIPWARPNYHGYEKKYVNQVLKSTWLGDGIFIRNFEKIFSKYIDSKSAISVSNGTIAIHLVYLAMGLKRGDEVIVPGFGYLAAANVALQMGIKPVFADVDPETFCVTAKNIEKEITNKTKVIAITHLSNVTGAVLPIKEITQLAHSKGIIVVVDGCQGGPHLKLDMQDLDCDFYAISCHKMYGPTGLGVLYGKKKWLEQLPPYQGGGGMINEVKKDRISYGDLPNKYEAGTMATAQVIAFDQSIKFLESIGIENIIKHEKELIEYGQEILQKNNSVKLIGNPKDRGGVLSFIIEGIHPHDIATILDETGVAIRAGHHCCQILHDKLGIPASARASLGVYNTKDDLDKLNEGINNCKKIFDLK